MKWYDTNLRRLSSQEKTEIQNDLDDEEAIYKGNFDGYEHIDGSSELRQILKVQGIESVSSDVFEQMMALLRKARIENIKRNRDRLQGEIEVL